MNKRSNSDLGSLVLALLVTASLLGGVAWLGLEAFFKGGSKTTAGTSLGGLQLPGFDRGPQANGKMNQVSEGDRSLFATAMEADQQAGFQAMAQQDYASAAASFQRSLNRQRNNPETRIFLNNALLGTTKATKLAVMIPSSTAPQVAKEMLRGVAQAQAAVNGQVGTGPKLRIVLADDGNDPAQGAAVVRTLAADREVVAIVGPATSTVAKAVIPVATAEKLVVISPTSTAVGLTGSSPYFFRTVPSDAIAARTLGDYLLKQFPKAQVAIVFNSKNPYSTSLQAEFKTTLAVGGGQTVAEFDIQAPELSMAKSLANAQSQGAKVLFLALGTQELDKALQVMMQNQGQLPIVAGDALYSPDTLEVPNCQTASFVVGVPWSMDTAGASPFVKDAWALWGAAVNWRSALAYDAVQAIATGLAQQSDPTNAKASRDDLRNALATSGFTAAGAAEEVRFMPSGDRLTMVQLLKVAPGATNPQQCSFKPL